MVRRSALAATVAAAIALGAPGCKPSSLTPLGIDTRGPETAGTDLNGLWQGTTATGGTVRFQVGDGKITTLGIVDQATGCARSFESTTGTEIVDGAFFLEIPLDQGRVVVEGRFTSSSTNSGSYAFEGLATAGPCPTKGSVAFIADKSP